MRGRAAETGGDDVLEQGVGAAGVGAGHLDVDAEADRADVLPLAGEQVGVQRAGNSLGGHGAVLPRE